MPKLSDTQLVILNAAAQRTDGNALPLPGSLRGGAASKVVGALLSRGLVAEHVTDSRAKADAALNTFWRTDDEGRAILLRITEVGLAAIGVEPEGPEDAPQAATSPPEAATQGASGAEATDTTTDAGAASTTLKMREGTKQAKLIALLREGATIDEMVAATGRQPHTVRGAMAGALKKRLGLTIVSDRKERGRVYRITD